jgi:hypothetical protein
MGVKLGLALKRRKEETEDCQDRVLKKIFQLKNGSDRWLGKMAQ